MSRKLNNAMWEEYINKFDACIRRYFHNIIVDLDEEALKNSRAIIGFNYCELDGSLEVDNNAAERAIKPFVIGRKNFLFANTAKGATASSKYAH